MGTTKSWILLAATITLLLPAGCGGDDGTRQLATVAEPGAWLDEHRYLGEPLVVDNLTVWPVHTDRPLEVGEFLTLEEAQDEGVAVVREVGAPAEASPAIGEGVPPPPPPAQPQQPGGQPQQDDVAQTEEVEAPSAQQRRVPAQTMEVEGQILGQSNQPPGQVARLAGAAAVVNTLVIDNQGDLPILVCAGTIVKGGKQDRQIGQDFVVAAKSSVPVDAFCVEPGRWQPRVVTATSSVSAFQFASFRAIAPKGARAAGQYEKDQGKVWEEVKEVLRDTGVQGTDTLVAAEEQADEETAAGRTKTLDAVLAHFTRLAEADPAPVGFAYAVDGKPVTVRTFAHARLLAGQLPAFAKAMALEASLAHLQREEGAAAPPAAKATDVVALVKAINEAEEERVETRALNVNGYRNAQAGFNGNCYLPDEDGDGRRAVKVTEDWTAR